MSKIAPNKLQLALQELATISFENDFAVPREIDEASSKNHYHIIGVRSSDTADGFSKIYRGKSICISQNHYNKISRQVKNKVIKQMFGGTWQRTIILHDPTLKPKVEKKKGLSPKAKGDIKKLYAEEMTAEDISTKLKTDLALTKAYINNKLA